MRVRTTREGDAPEESQEPLARVHAALDPLAQHVEEDGRRELLDEAVELEEAELQAGHVGRVVRAQVVGLHEAHEDRESLLVGHLRAVEGLSARRSPARRGYDKRKGRRTLSKSGPTMNCRPCV